MILMVNRGFIGIIVLLFVFPLVSAVPTTMTVKTFTNSDVSVYVLRAEGVYYLLSSHHGNSGAEGKVNFTFDVNESLVDIKVIIKKSKQTLMNGTYEDQSTGSPLAIDLPKIEDPAMAVGVDTTTPALNNETTGETNETSNETVGTENTNSTTANAPITGQVISDEEQGNGNLLKYVLYAVGALLVIAGLLFMSFFLARRNKSNRPSYGMKPMKLMPSARFNTSLEDVERKINQVDQQIEALKNRDKVLDAERRLQERMKTLQQLKQQK